jgi:hypothetical protein
MTIDDNRYQEIALVIKDLLECPKIVRINLCTQNHGKWLLIMKNIKKFSSDKKLIECLKPTRISPCD